MAKIEEKDRENENLKNEQKKLNSIDGYFKKVVLISTLLFFVCTAFAQKNSEKTGSLLWKISGNGLTQPSYIFGTHHLFPISFLDSVAGLKQAFSACKQVVGELAMQDMLALSNEVQVAGMMPQDTTWQMLLSEADYRFVDEKLTAVFGTGLQTFGMFKPAMVSMSYVVAFYQSMFPQTDDATPPDIWFQQEAVKKEMPVVGLETVQEQIFAIFGFASLKRQAADFVCALKNTDYTLRTLVKLNNLYRSADLNGVAKMFKEKSPCPSNGEQEKVINTARNKQWLKKLPAIMKEKPSFIAVGMMHLAGKDGLLHGLEQAGYTVEAVVTE